MSIVRIQAFIIFILLSFIIVQYFLNERITLTEENSQKTIKNNVNLFKKLGDKSRTDKTTFHHYEHLYGTHVGPFRDRKINFLEIGLGCGMGYGPGKSLMLWKKFLPQANLYEMEYDVSCAEKFRSQVKQLFTGDQSDLNLLKRIGDEVGHFDVIVDDGGHSRKQQVNSLIGLWPFLSSSGVYIIEDMYHSFVDHKSYNDNKESSIDLMMELLILLNDPLEIAYIRSLNSRTIKPNITIRDHAEEINKSLLSINCFKRACVLYKK